MLRALAGTGLIVALGTLTVTGGPAWGEDPYPTRPVSMVVAFPPGGLADNTARPVATALERILRQPVAIINKAGAAGAVGNQTVATSKPDGYTLLMALVSISVLPEVDKLFGRETLGRHLGALRINTSKPTARLGKALHQTDDDGIGPRVKHDGNACRCPLHSEVESDHIRSAVSCSSALAGASNTVGSPFTSRMCRTYCLPSSPPNSLRPSFNPSISA
jgi:Tripartite tricarboxylate transporter family receptor